MTSEAEKRIQENSKFSVSEIKKRMKSKSKGELINIILNLSLVVDKHVAHNEEVRGLVNSLNDDGAFKEYVDYSNLIDLIDRKISK